MATNRGILGLMLSGTLVAGVAACGDDESANDGDTGTGADDGASGDDGAGDGGDGGSGDDGDDGDDGGDGATGDGDTGDGGTDDGGTDDGGGDGPTPTDLPTPQGPCPEFTEGTVTVEPSTGARDVRVWVSGAAGMLDGPLVFYWHGTGSSPMEAVWGLSQQTIDAVKSLGGMVVAPTSDPNSGTWPWYLVSGMQEDDLLVADEVLACAIETMGIDTRRIHSIGMSAGGLHTAQMSLRRASYIASVGVYSGGVLYGMPPNADPSNKFAAMIFHGGETDVVSGADFPMASENYKGILDQNGNFAFICDHGNGHTLPMDATGSVWEFFTDHPYGTDPSPYAGGLPGGFPSYCAL